MDFISHGPGRPPVLPIRQMLPPVTSAIGNARGGIASAIGSAPASDGSPAGMLVSRILQMALGLFVTTMEMPVLPPDMASNPGIGFDCDFATPCRWGSMGQTQDKWRVARGEPDALLWLAATGTMVLPSEPFALIEIHRGSPPDMLSSDVLNCQREPSLFSFTYWTIGSSDLEICLLDQYYRQFNCTGMLQSHIQPGKVALKIPPIKHPFHISIIPSADQGILVIDDIKYDARYCGKPPPVVQPLPLFPTDPPVTPSTPLPWTMMPLVPLLPTTTLPASITYTPFISPMTMPTGNPWMVTSTSYPFQPITGQLITFPTPTTTTTTITTATTSTTTSQITTTSKLEKLVVPVERPKPLPLKPASPTPNTTESPDFELLIIGNKTSPLHDRRRGRIIDDTGDLLCDFANNFPCFWGPEAGRWAVIEKGAIPSLEEKLGNAESPAYPAAVVIQGTAMFTSDPIRCQTGEGKLLFRYWTNGRVLIQICAMGFNVDSGKIQCVEEVAKPSSLDDTTLAVFALANSIKEPFTLNIIPIWERDSRNTYLVIDEIAYIGECNTTVRNQLGHGQGGDISEEEEEEGDLASKEVVSATVDPHAHIIYTPKSHTRRPSAAHKATSTSPKPTIIATSTSGPYTIPLFPSPPTYPRPLVPSLPIDPRQRPFTTTPKSSQTSSSWKPGTRYPFLPTGPTLRPPKSTITLLGVTSISSLPLPKAITEVLPKSSPRSVGQEIEHTTVRGSFTIPYTTTPRYLTTTTREPPIDYCKLLNCDFNDNACNYLNHGLTKVPWTLRSKGYGFPLSRHTDLRLTLSNGQFISSVLGPGDYSILESPRFNLTQGINVLLFQYYRPTHSSTIRLCMGTRYTKPLRTVNSFLQCPPILRSLTSKNAYKWNSVHVGHLVVTLCVKVIDFQIQLPPGTSNFYLIAHNLDRSLEKTAIAIDNIRVAICDPRSFDPTVKNTGDNDELSYEIYQNER